MIIKIPSPLKGYLNLGDCVVLLSGWLLPPAYAFAAAGIGSGLADVFSGYLVYAPATFLIKGIMAIIAYYCFKGTQSKIGKFPSRITGGTLAEIEMVAGYYIFEGLIYGFLPSSVNIPANAVQGIAGLILGLILVKIFEKTKMF
jgi:uncharacterized membrane protein